MTTPNPPQYHYICFDCEEKAQNGNTTDSIFTVHTAKCEKCGAKKAIGHVNDFGLDNQLVFRNLAPLD